MSNKTPKERARERYLALQDERDRLVLRAIEQEATRANLAEAALSRIRAAMEKHGDWTGLDTPQGLAASVDTFIETHANLPKVERWYAAAMTRVSHALRKTDEMPYYCNDVAIDRLVAEIEKLRGEPTGGTCPTCCNHADGDCETVRVSRNFIRLIAAERSAAEARCRELEGLHAELRDVEYACGMYANIASPHYARLIDVRKRINTLLSTPSASPARLDDTAAGETR